jgi:hypothetical protein
MANKSQSVVHESYFPRKKTIDGRQREIIEELIRVRNLRVFSENNTPSVDESEEREVSDDTASIEWEELSQVENSVESTEANKSDDITTVESEEFNQIESTSAANGYGSDRRADEDSYYCDCEYCSFNDGLENKRQPGEHYWEELLECISKAKATEQVAEQSNEHCSCYGGTIHFAEVSSPTQQEYFRQFMPLLATHDNAFLSFKEEGLNEDDAYRWLTFRHMAKLILAGRACEFHKGQTLRPRYGADFMVVTGYRGNLSEVRVDMVDDQDEDIIN